LTKKKRGCDEPPMTDHETAALEYAQRLVRWFHTGGTPWGSDSPFSVTASRAFMRSILRGGAMASPSNRMSLVGAALAGEPDAVQVVGELIQEFKTRNISLPIELSFYVMFLAQRDMGRVDPAPPQGTGPKMKDRFYRNIALCMILSAVAGRSGLPITGRSGRWRSAARIVAEAYGIETRGGIGDKSIERIWGIMGHNVPTGPARADMLDGGMIGTAQIAAPLVAHP
jgi:hypothetical protein